MTTFHLAIPSHDLILSKNFYTMAFGATIGQQYAPYVIFNFFNHQLVTHFDPEGISSKVKMYPRHYAIILSSQEELTSIYNKCKWQKHVFLKNFLKDMWESQDGIFAFLYLIPHIILLKLNIMLIKMIFLIN